MNIKEIFEKQKEVISGLEEKASAYKKMRDEALFQRDEAVAKVSLYAQKNEEVLKKVKNIEERLEASKNLRDDLKKDYDDFLLSTQKAELNYLAEIKVLENNHESEKSRASKLLKIAIASAIISFALGVYAMHYIDKKYTQKNSQETKSMSALLEEAFSKYKKE